MIKIRLRLNHAEFIQGAFLRVSNPQRENSLLSTNTITKLSSHKCQSLKTYLSKVLIYTHTYVFLYNKSCGLFLLYQVEIDTHLQQHETVAQNWKSSLEMNSVPHNLSRNCSMM